MPKLASYPGTQRAFENCVLLQSIELGDPTGDQYMYEDDLAYVGRDVPEGTDKILYVPTDATGYDTNWLPKMPEGWTISYTL